LSTPSTPSLENPLGFEAETKQEPGALPDGRVFTSVSKAKANF
jgi:hypothetical protein